MAILSWRQLASDLAPGNVAGLLRVLGLCPQLGRHVRTGQLRSCQSDRHLLNAQRSLLENTLASRELSAPTSNAASTGILLVVGDCGENEAGEDWRAALEPAIPVWIRVRPDLNLKAAGSTRIWAEALDLTNEFARSIEAAVQAARISTGQLRESVVVEVVGPCPLPSVGGRSHELPVFLLAAFFFRYRLGLPTWLAATGKLEQGCVHGVSGIHEKADLARRLGARVLLLPEDSSLGRQGGDLTVKKVPGTEALDLVLARVERLVFEKDASYLRLSLPEFQSRLVWIERVLVDQRRDHKTALSELEALTSITSRFPGRYPNEAVYLLELKARIFSRDGRSAEGVRAVKELQERVQAARQAHSLDLRHQWVWSDLLNRHANIWLYAYDFATAIEMAEEALEGFTALRKAELASSADVARVKGTLGHGHLYSARVGVDRATHLKKAERLFKEALDEIDEADAPRNQNHLGFLALERGEPRDAEEQFRAHLQEDVADRLSSNLPHTLWGLARCAHALAAGGAPEESEPLVEEIRRLLLEAVALGRCRRGGYPEVMVQRYLGRALLECGHVEAGLKDLTLAATFFPDDEPPLGHAAAPLGAACRLDLAHALLNHNGDSDRARQALEGAHRQLLAFGSPDAVPGHDPLAAGRAYLAPLVNAVEETLAGLDTVDLGCLRREIDRIPW